MLHPLSAPNYADRIGFAQLTRQAFEGVDLHPLRDQLLARVEKGTAHAGEGLDLSLIAQLLGDKQAGLAIQAEVLAAHQLYRSPCSSEQPKLRVLALAAAIDMGGNTPIEFLLENSGIELQTLYVVSGVGLPVPLPEHDVAIVIASDSEECVEALRKIDAMAPRWPRPLLNPPRCVRHLDRDKLHGLLRGVGGLEIPATLHASLMARLDRLGAAKELAQVGSAIGREFAHALIEAVAGKSQAELETALNRLISAGLLFRQGVPPYATYVFKHALVQDAA